MVKHGPQAINELLQQGVKFSQKTNPEELSHLSNHESNCFKLSLTKEGGHSQRRIAYIGDYTGEAIAKTLIKQTKAQRQILISPYSFAFQLLITNRRCFGALLIKNKKIIPIFSKYTILATGGIGDIYEYSTNPQIATGDGIAMAHLARSVIKDLEFIQFHPTALNLNQKPHFLISEAMRGEGAILLNHKLRPFMQKVHPLADLAPRDIVARAVYQELKKGAVYLDISHKKATFVKKRFPHIYATLKNYGLDITKKSIPITPAAHYSCGGIKTNLYGETNLKNLLAYGEVTCTGVHGANRLASNSLLEAVVFSSHIFHKNITKLDLSTKINQNIIKHFTKNLPKYRELDPKLKKFLHETKFRVKQIMWRKVGIVRVLKKLKEAKAELTKLNQALSKVDGLDKELVETKNMILTASLITNAALKRKKSLGCHYIEAEDCNLLA